VTFLLANWKALAMAFIGAGCLALAAYAWALRAENRGLEASLARSEARLASLSHALATNQAALSARIEAAQALAKEKDEIITNLRKLYETDEEACNWGDARVPDSVYAWLCGPGGGN
jgi:hypothetical protein